MNISKESKSAAFTLIELLVVISFRHPAAMLPPALAKAKEKAQRTICSSHYKQLLLAHIMYVSDNNERIEPPNWVARNGALNKSLPAGWLYKPGGSVLRHWAESNQRADPGPFLSGDEKLGHVHVSASSDQQLRVENERHQVYQLFDEWGGD